MLTGPKIKIAQVITRLDWGGSPDIFRILSTHLDPEKYDVTLITGPTEHPTVKTQAFLERFAGRVIVIPSMKREIRARDDILTLISLYSIFRREKFAVVHTHTAKAGALGRLAAKLSGGSVVVHTPHGHNFYGYFGPRASSMIVRIETFLAGITDRIIALTELEKADYIQFAVADSKKISVIYQGLELDANARDWKEGFDIRRSVNLHSGGHVVGMVGRLEPVKGSGFFIEAASIIGKAFPETRFLIIGEGSLRPKMEERAAELGIKENIYFTGWRDDAAEMISAMDVLVMPSLNEAVGIVLIEAGSKGVPVVATKVGGIPEVVRDQKTGILIEPSNVSAIAESVSALLADEPRRKAIGEAAKVWVHDKFRAEEMAHKTSALYIELLNNRRCLAAQGV